MTTCQKIHQRKNFFRHTQRCSPFRKGRRICRKSPQEGSKELVTHNGVKAMATTLVLGTLFTEGGDLRESDKLVQDFLAPLDPLKTLSWAVNFTKKEQDHPFSNIHGTLLRWASWAPGQSPPPWERTDINKMPTRITRDLVWLHVYSGMSFRQLVISWQDYHKVMDHDRINMYTRDIISHVECTGCRVGITRIRSSLCIRMSTLDNGNVKFLKNMNFLNFFRQRHLNHQLVGPIRDRPGQDLKS